MASAVCVKSIFLEEIGLANGTDVRRLDSVEIIQVLLKLRFFLEGSIAFSTCYGFVTSFNVPLEEKPFVKILVTREIRTLEI